MAVAAVLVGTAVVASDSTAPPPTGAAARGQADSIRVPLRYGPTWLPGGSVERGRTLSSRERDHARISGEFRVYRTWWASPVDPVDGGGYVSIGIASDPMKDMSCEGGETADINGVSAVHRRSTDNACVYWPVDPNTRILVMVGGAGIDLGDALRVARSMRPADGVFLVPFSLQRRDFLYGESGGTYIRISGTSPTEWTAETKMGPDAKNDPRELIVTVGTTTEAPPGGTDHPVDGRSGRYVSVHGNVNSNFLVFEVGPRLLLTVRYWRAQGGVPPPVTELVKVAERVRVGTPDMSWIGTG